MRKIVSKRIKTDKRKKLVNSTPNDSDTKHIVTETAQQLSLYIKNGKIHTPIIFIFPGQGSTGALPLTYLRQKLPVYDTYIRRTEKLLLKIAPQLNLIKILEKSKTENTLEEQLFSYAHGIAMAQQYITWGIKPDIIAGHSAGEITALALSEIITQEKALEYLYKRAELMNSCSHGVMSVIFTAETETGQIIKEYQDLSVAAVNDKDTCVVSGSEKSMKKIERKCDRNGIRHKRLKVHLAAHSKLLDPILAQLEQIDKGIIRIPKYTTYSTVTGNEINISEIASGAWNIKHTREKVQFCKTLENIKNKINSEKPIFIEFGVHRVLAGSGRKILPGSKWYGSTSIQKYIQDKSREYCFTQGIRQTLKNISEQLS